MCLCQISNRPQVERPIRTQGEGAVALPKPGPRRICREPPGERQEESTGTSTVVVTLVQHSFSFFACSALCSMLTKQDQAGLSVFRCSPPVDSLFLSYAVHRPKRCPRARTFLHAQTTCFPHRSNRLRLQARGVSSPSMNTSP
jgi:hypothetical protein